MCLSHKRLEFSPVHVPHVDCQRHVDTVAAIFASLPPDGTVTVASSGILIICLLAKRCSALRKLAEYPTEVMQLPPSPATRAGGQCRAPGVLQSGAYIRD